VTVAELVGSLEASAGHGGGRLLVGIAGCPGAGKSTLAERIVHEWNRRTGPSRARAVHVPMDGFHLANAELGRLGRAGRKGAPDTFDALGYVALLQRIRGSSDQTIWAPAFERSLEEPIAGAIAIEPEVGLVVTEGNYLLLEDPGWHAVRDLLDHAWYLELGADVRQERLVARHVAYGRTPEAARVWAATTDEPNARRIAATRSRADRVLRLEDEGVRSG
jgi:pantothenate kinase